MDEAIVVRVQNSIGQPVDRYKITLETLVLFPAVGCVWRGLRREIRRAWRNKVAGSLVIQNEAKRVFEQKAKKRGRRWSDGSFILSVCYRVVVVSEKKSVCVCVYACMCALLRRVLHVDGLCACSVDSGRPFGDDSGALEREERS